MRPPPRASRVRQSENHGYKQLEVQSAACIRDSLAACKPAEGRWRRGPSQSPEDPLRVSVL